MTRIPTENKLVCVSNILRGGATGHVTLRNESHILSKLQFKPAVRVVFSCKKKTSVGMPYREVFKNIFLLLSLRILSPEFIGFLESVFPCFGWRAFGAAWREDITRNS